ncbi:MAG: SMI1/KNR4 family protein [bacterium]|nr:SMI1/KNR4 family protein [bacterium]
MTPDELDRIESELGITLPELYRQAVDPYPIPALEGNTDWMFWDDAEALISLNRRMREGERFRDPWPARFYALGKDAGGCSDALDLEDPEYGVFERDRGPRCQPPVTESSLLNLP